MTKTAFNLANSKVRDLFSYRKILFEIALQILSMVWTLAVTDRIIKERFFMATDIITMHSRYLYRKSNVLKAKIEHINSFNS